MRDAGIEHVFQLDGGVLKYFEETGGAHWEGGCFVFDNRGAVGPDLLPLPAGERAGVRGQSCDDPAIKPAPINALASTRPSPQSSPQRGEVATA
jgi:UPF0176 protein